MSGILLLGLIAGLGTCLGALFVIILGRMRPGTLALMLGLAAGIMTAIIIFDLLPSSLRYGHPAGVLAGFIGGIVIMLALESSINMLHPANQQEWNYLKTGYLIATGIALHDVPEGLAIAAGFATVGQLGPHLALAIGLHNIPEGMAVAAPLRRGGLGAGRVLAINFFISLITPAGTFLGLALTEYSRALTGPLLAFAAGAMTYIVIGELVPASRRNNSALAYLGTFIGICLISALKFIA